jgi:hypothetical protein
MASTKIIREGRRRKDEWLMAAEGNPPRLEPDAPVPLLTATTAVLGPRIVVGSISTSLLWVGSLPLGATVGVASTFVVWLPGVGFWIGGMGELVGGGADEPLL